MLQWVTRTALAAILAATAVGAASAGKGDVFVGTFKDDQKPIVVFAFESASSPKDAMAVYVDPKYDQKIGEKFEPVKACRFTFDFENSPIPVKYNEKAIYGPSSGQKTVNFPDLPTFFTVQAMKMLVENKYVELKTPRFAYYSSCISFVWALTLSRSGKEWKETLKKNKIEPKRKTDTKKE